MTGGGAGEEPPPVYAETYFPQFFMGWAPLRSIRDRPLEVHRRAGAGAVRPVGRPRRADERLASASRPPPPPCGARWTPDRAPARAAWRRRRSAPRRASGWRRWAMSAPVTPPASGTAACRRPIPSAWWRSSSGCSTATARWRADEPDEAARIAARGARRRMRAMRSRSCCWPRGPGAGQEPRGDGRVQGLPDAGARQRRCASLDGAGGASPRRSRSARWRKRRRRWRSIRGTRAAISLRAGLLFSSGREGRGHRRCARRWQRIRRTRRCGLELADLLADAGRFAEAEPEYRQVIAARPGDGRALTGLGLVLGATEPARTSRWSQLIARARGRPTRRRGAIGPRRRSCKAGPAPRRPRGLRDGLQRAAARPDFRRAAPQKARKIMK